MTKSSSVPEAKFGQHFHAPLKGVKVVDLSHVQAGPICGMMLADMGAEVIKIESLDGDMYRGPVGGAYFQNFNRNKRSIALDLKSKEGLQIALDLCSKADVFLENFLPGAMNRLGLGYEAISKLNPSIIYASVSGFGQDGAQAKRPAFDPAIQALSGFMDSMGEADRPPVRTRTAMIDYSAGTTMAFAVAAALFRRAKEGAGEHIDIALMDIGLYAMSPYVTYYKSHGITIPRTGSAHPDMAPNQSFKVRDGYLYIAATSDRMWRGLCQLLGIESVAEDPRFLTPSARSKNATVLIDTISPVIASQDGVQFEEQLLAAGIPCGRVRTVAEVSEDPYLDARGMFEVAEGWNKKGELKAMKTPVRLSGVSSPLRRSAPGLGEHTAEILAELGYQAADIESLAQKKVILGGKQ